MKKIYKPNEFAKMLNVTVKTLQNWDNDGKLIAYRNPSGRRFYTNEQYEAYMGINQRNQVGKTVIYGRVSNNGQKDDLQNQLAFLREFANARGMIVDDVMTDIGSGLNYKRKHWNALLEDCFDGQISTIIVAHKDRFVRFGYEWFESFLSKRGVKVLVVNNETLSPQQELVEDLVSIIHVFSCRIYGLRKYKKKIEEDESFE
ncbi:IS607 family transposase [Sporosarcina sp. HYO08]|uniref:IS607 family transposase n=2 Tax=Sporosarcina sp. HYO08 TaxID=1759557 RepID=UPI000793E70C|nr:DNA invertase [Sporosarcina sp. HYO08]